MLAAAGVLTVQELLSAGWKQNRPASRSSMFSSSEGSPDEGAADGLGGSVAHEASYHTLLPEPVLGCKHYMRNCKKFADCCQRWITCRFCHDEEEEHVYDRFATTRMLCMFCKTEQAAAQVCSNMACGRAMATYYCELCKFWDNDPSKDVFHCAKCKLCRVGLQENFCHCEKCNACITNDYFAQHKCIERSLECDCSICGEYLFTSIAPVMFMPCGHSIHFICHREHMRTSYQCPVCLKSLGDMKDYFARIDQLMETQRMPAEFALTRAQILCNDCERRSVVKFHFMYHKCAACESYNTKLIKTFTVAGEDEDESRVLVEAEPVHPLSNEQNDS